METTAKTAEATLLKFCRIFEITPEVAKSLKSKYSKEDKFAVDLFKLEDWLEANKGYNHYGSMKCFIQKVYGENAVKFVLDNL